MLILITHHAFDRWIEYGGRPNKNKLKSLVRRNLIGHLRVGLLIDHTGAAQLPIEGLWATVIPGEIGWIVVTIHKGEKFTGESEGVDNSVPYELHKL